MKYLSFKEKTLKSETKRFTFFILVLIILTFFKGCTFKNVPKSENISKSKPENLEKEFKITYSQFGNQLFIKNKKKFKIEGAKKVKKTSFGWIIEPAKKCVKLVDQKHSKTLCIKPVPQIFPHIQILQIDSYALDLKILSVFPNIAIFIWEKGKEFDFQKPLVFSPGIHSLKNLTLGKTYFIAGAIRFGNNVYGPLSSPIEVKMEDKTPPEPPSGGGYLIKKDTIILVWNKSPSRDVAGYLIERKGEIFRVKENTFQENLTKEYLLKKTIVYTIKAVDKAGNTSLPLYIKVSLKP